MTTTSDVQTATTAWSEDISVGAAALAIVRQGFSSGTLLVHIGATKPAANSLAGIDLSDSERLLELGAPMLTTSDKVYVRALANEVRYLVVKP